MKKLVLMLAVGTVLGFSASAQNKDEKSSGGTSLSVGVEAGMPIGDLKDAGAKLGLGGSLKVAFPVVENGAITVSAGYISFGGEKIDMGPLGSYKPKYNIIPLKAGFRYNFSGSGFYVEPQVGYTLASVKVDTESDSNGGFTWAPNVGYLINNMVDLSVRYESASIEGTSFSHVGFRVAYNFNFGGK